MKYQNSLVEQHHEFLPLVLVFAKQIVVTVMQLVIDHRTRPERNKPYRLLHAA